jgi:hypothetical protein
MMPPEMAKYGFTLSYFNRRSLLIYEKKNDQENTLESARIYSSIVSKDH